MSEVASEMMKILKSASDESLIDDLKKYINDVDKDWNYIVAPDLLKKKDKYFLLDTRKKEDFEKEHIKGAKNIFWKDILDNLDKLPKDKEIIIICYVGHTASQVLVLLKLLGYKAKVLKFGMGISPVEGIPVAGWLNYGYETEKGKKK